MRLSLAENRPNVSGKEIDSVTDSGQAESVSIYNTEALVQEFFSSYS